MQFMHLKENPIFPKNPYERGPWERDWNTLYILTAMLDDDPSIRLLSHRVSPHCTTGNPARRVPELSRTGIWHIILNKR